MAIAVSPSKEKLFDRTPCFFKVFLPELCSRHLRIPPGFSKHIEKVPPGSLASLEGPSGRVWEVGLVEKVSDGLWVIEEGWEGFVADHSLVAGDFLLFGYDGGLRFRVQVFDTTACEKEAGFFARPCQKDVVFEEEEDLGGEGSEGSEGLVSSVPEEEEHVLSSSPKRKRRKADSDPGDCEILAKETRECSDCLTVKRLKSSHNGRFTRSMLKAHTIDDPNNPCRSTSTRKSGVNDKLSSQNISFKKSISFTAANKSKFEGPPYNIRTRKAKEIESKTVPVLTPQKQFHVDHKASRSTNRSSSRKAQSTSQTSDKRKNSEVDSGFLTLVISDEISRRGEGQFHVGYKASRSANRSSNRKGQSPGETNDKRRTSKEESEFLTLVISDEFPQCGEDTVRVCRMRSLVSQRRPVTQEEMDRALQMANSFKSKKPSVAVCMRESYVCHGFCMNIPMPFGRKYLPCENSSLTLWDPNGKPWTVTYIYSGGRGSLSAGWGKFSYAHNLEKGDVCVFELVKSSQLKVHIFRVVEKITPLIRQSDVNNHDIIIVVE